MADHTMPSGKKVGGIQTVFMSLFPWLDFANVTNGYEERQIGLYQKYIELHGGTLFSLNKGSSYSGTKKNETIYQFGLFSMLIELMTLLYRGKMVFTVVAYPSILRKVWALPYFIVLRKISRLRVILDVHDLPGEQIEAFNMIGSSKTRRLLFKVLDLCFFHLASDKILVASQPLCEYISAHYSVSNKKLYFSPNSSFPDFFKPQPTIASKGDEFNVIYMGSLMRSKGIGGLFKAIKSCREYGINVKLTLLGKLMMEINPEEYITSARVPYENIPSIIESADLCAIPFSDAPYFHLAFPIKLLDYMSAGKAVLSTPLRGVKPILERYDCGISAPMEEWPKIILHLNSNRSELTRMGINGRKAVTAFYNWDSRVNELHQILGSLLCE